MNITKTYIKLRNKLLLIIFLMISYKALSGDFRVKPYLQNPTTDTITIVWFSDISASGNITYKSSLEPEHSVSSVPISAPQLTYQPSEISKLPGGVDPGPPYKHKVQLNSLSPGTIYSYKVRQGSSECYGSFHTFPDKFSSVRFIIYGDSETEPESNDKYTLWPDPAGIISNRYYYIDQTAGYKANLDVIQSRNPDFIIIVGDLVETGGEQRDWDEFWLHNAGYRNLAGTIPIFPVMGNHEYYNGSVGGYSQPYSETAVAKFLTYFEVPSNNSPNPFQEKRYYRKDFGPVAIIVLDVVNGLPNGTASDSNLYILGETEGGNAPDFNPNSRQYLWLETQLSDAQKNCLFTFVCFHNIPYSVGDHSCPPGSPDNQSGVPVRVLTPLLLKYGVDAVFAGHDEMYEHSVIDGVELLPNGFSRTNKLHFYDIGIGGDGLRGPVSGYSNSNQTFLAHKNSAEIYNNNILADGGKHYGHIEVNVEQDNNTNEWKAIITPVYIFPITEFQSNIITVTGYDRRIYNDEITLIYKDSSSPTATPTLTPIATLTPIQTETPLPTAIPTGTPTPVPTATPIGSPTITPNPSPTPDNIAVIKTYLISGNPVKPGDQIKILYKVSYNTTNIIPVSFAFRVKYPSNSVSAPKFTSGELGGIIYGPQEGTPPDVFKNFLSLSNISNTNMLPICGTLVFDVLSNPVTPYTISIDDHYETKVCLIAPDLKTNIPHIYDNKFTTDMNGTPTPSPTPSPSPTPTHTPTPSPTPSPTLTNTPTPSLTPTPTPTPSITTTPSPTFTLTPTPTPYNRNIWYSY